MKLSFIGWFGLLLVALLTAAGTPSRAIAGGGTGQLQYAAESNYALFWRQVRVAPALEDAGFAKMLRGLGMVDDGLGGWRLADLSGTFEVSGRPSQRWVMVTFDPPSPCVIAPSILSSLVQRSGKVEILDSNRLSVLVERGEITDTLGKGEVSTPTINRESSVILSLDQGLLLRSIDTYEWIRR